MASKKELSLSNVVIDYDPAKRIDKYRENALGAVSLHPATIKDAGGEIPAIAKVTKSDNPTVRDNLKKTGNIHRSLHDHPFVTKVLGIHESEDRVVLLLEEGIASLRDLNRNTPQMKALKKELFGPNPNQVVLDFIRGMAYIHSSTIDVNNKISHRDIKPENILLFRQKRDGKLALKFTDFDSSKQLNVDAMVNITSGVFTFRYLDPQIEKLKKEQRMASGRPSSGSSAAQASKINWKKYLGGDVYSGGCVIYEMLANGEYLYEGKSEAETMMKRLNNDRSNLFKSKIPELGKNLIHTMTQTEVEDRISAEEAEIHIFFYDENFHIQALKSINEALIGLDPLDPDTKRIKDAFNESFFLIFQDDWQKLPFIVPEILKHSKYSRMLDAFLRYCRNTMAHAEQHRESLQKHFGKEMSAVDFLKAMLIGAPFALIHFYWFAKKYLPHLPCAEKLPANCAKAHEERMEEAKNNISGGWEAMYTRVCPQLAVAAAPVDEVARLEEIFEQSLAQIGKTLDKSDGDFKRCKKEVRDWEKKMNQLQKVVENKIKSKRPEKEIEESQKKLNGHLETRPALKWIVDARDIMRNQREFKESKATNLICKRDYIVYFHCSNFLDASSHLYVPPLLSWLVG